jgi:hypothetical protein
MKDIVDKYVEAATPKIKITMQIDIYKFSEAARQYINTAITHQKDMQMREIRQDMNDTQRKKPGKGRGERES